MLLFDCLISRKYSVNTFFYFDCVWLCCGLLCVRLS